jgi:hypothetical protein
MAKVLAILSLCTCCSVANAGELGNLFSPKDQSVDTRSREASATALQGVQSIISALQHSELRQLDARKESLSSASSVLDSAVTKMNSITIPDEANLQVIPDRLTEDERNYLIYVRDKYLGEKGFPNNVREAYTDFISLTMHLSMTVKNASTSNDEILPKEVINETARYLSIGGTISRLIGTVYSSPNSRPAIGGTR